MTDTVPQHLIEGLSPERRIYDDYKHRMEHHAKWGVANEATLIAEAKQRKQKYAPKGHRHNMAVRYAVKMFLMDLYAVWKQVEGLPAHIPYHEAKLGLRHGEAA